MVGRPGDLSHRTVGEAASGKDQPLPRLGNEQKTREFNLGLVDLTLYSLARAVQLPGSQAPYRRVSTCLVLQPWASSSTALSSALDILRVES